MRRNTRTRGGAILKSLLSAKSDFESSDPHLQKSILSTMLFTTIVKINLTKKVTFAFLP
jgi:hypothetical protein